jgi:uncharacterized protein YndB with AHSA1/START domain
MELLRYVASRTVHRSALFAVIPVTVLLFGIAYAGAASGHSTALMVGDLVLIVALGLVGLRWFMVRQARIATFVPHRVEASIRLGHSPEKVWSLIVPAENAWLLSPEGTRSSHVAGTPIGLGERQASVDARGTAHVHEVVEYDEPRRVVAKVVSPRTPVRLASVYELEPVDGGCKYTLAFEVDGPPGAALTEDEEKEWQASIQDHLHRVWETLTTWPG